MQAEIQETLRAGVAAHAAGKFEAADKIFSAILKIMPNHPDALHNLGVISSNRGNLVEALGFFERAVILNANYLPFWQSYLTTLKKLNKFSQARPMLEKAVAANLAVNVVEYVNEALQSIISSQMTQAALTDSVKYDYTTILTKMSVSSAVMLAEKKAKSGMFVEAETIGGVILKSYPNNKKIKILLQSFGEGNLAIPPQKFTEYLLEKITKGKFIQVIELINNAQEKFSKSALLYYYKGIAFDKINEEKTAVIALREAIELQPDLEDAIMMLGYILQRNHSGLSEALNCFKKVTEINPHSAHGFNNLGSVYKGLHLLDGAQKCFEKAIELNPNYDQAHSNLGNIKKELGDSQAALDLYERALQINPNFAEASNNMGVVLQEIGDFDRAIEYYESAIRIKKDYAEAYRNLSALKKYPNKNALFNQMEKVYQEGGMDADPFYNLVFALAKANDEIGNTEKAFKYYIEANALRKKVLNYDISQDIGLFRNIKNQATKFPNLNSDLSSELASCQPIFILGMPRSGTSLVEQIITSHSQVTGGGEIGFIEEHGKIFAMGAVSPSAQMLSDFGKKYLKNLTKLSNGRPYVTDKMPQNFRFIPLIFSIFPDAKIIHLSRDPMATLWSNFKHCFTTRGLGYTYDLNDSIKYYQLYKDAMSTWNTLFPGRIYELDYEKLTQDQEKETKNLISYLEIDFEDAVLAPEDNDRRVATASNEQIRQGVYKGSSKEWMKFEPYLREYIQDLTLYIK